MTHPTPRTDAVMREFNDYEELVELRGLALTLERDLAAERDAASGWMKRAGELESEKGELVEALKNLLADYREAMSEWGAGTDVYEKASKLADAADAALAKAGK